VAEAYLGGRLELGRAPYSSATPSSVFGQAVVYARNKWPTLLRYLDDARFAIDNGVVEYANRPLAAGRSNWLHEDGLASGLHNRRTRRIG